MPRAGRTAKGAAMGPKIDTAPWTPPRLAQPRDVTTKRQRGKTAMGLCRSAVSATLLMTGCYTGLEGFDPDQDPDAPPPGADDAGDDADGDGDGEPDDQDDEPCRTAGRTATRLLTAAEYEHSV